MVENYACTTCGRGFSRKSSAIRHVDTVEKGYADVLPYAAYVAGLRSGLRLPPQYAPTYKKRRQRKVQEALIDKLVEKFLEEMAGDAWKDPVTRNAGLALIQMRIMHEQGQSFDSWYL
jgi:hypothetical protein